MDWDITVMKAAAAAHPTGPAQRRQSGGDAPTDTAEHLERTCRDMESLFVYQLLKEMRATVDKSGLMEGGSAEDVYTSMLDAQVAREVTAGPGIGLSDLLFRQLAGRQEK